MFRKAQIRVCCVGLENQKRPHDDQKWRCSGAERKAMERSEYRELPVDPCPRACVVTMEELPGVPDRAICTARPKSKRFVGKSLPPPPYYSGPLAILPWTRRRHEDADKLEVTLLLQLRCYCNFAALALVSRYTNCDWLHVFAKGKIACMSWRPACYSRL